MYNVNVQMVIESGEGAEGGKKQMFQWCTRSMEIFAKQQSIAFAEWADRNYCQCDRNSKNANLWYKIGEIEKGRYTTEQLFEIFNPSI